GGRRAARRQGGQGQCGRTARPGRPVRRHEHPHPAGVQRRQAGQPVGGQPAQSRGAGPAGLKRPPTSTSSPFYSTTPPGGQTQPGGVFFAPFPCTSFTFILRYAIMKQIGYTRQKVFG